MKKTLTILFAIILISCNGKNKNGVSEVNLEKKELISKPDKQKNIELEESIYNKILDSIKLYRFEPIDTLTVSYEPEPKQVQKYKISNNEIEIYRKDSLNISWIKINSNKFLVDNLKTINPRVDGENERMFCNNLEKIKLYNFKNNKIIFLVFSFHPCTGLGCSVSDYLIYNVNQKQINLFGTFRCADMDLYNFPFSSEINFIGTEYKGNFHGSTPVSFISRVYSMKKDGKFKIFKDKNDREYYYKITTYPNDTLKHIECKPNWF